MKSKLNKSVFAIWIAAVSLGYGCLLNYSSKPAVTTSGPSHFPQSESQTLELNKNGQTLIAFFHPQCPCSRATVAELSRVLTRQNIFKTRTNLKVYAVISKPAGTDASFVRSSLVSALEAMKGVQVVIDDNDEQSRQFGAQASGQILLFNQQGEKLFSGGITAERGHEGESSGGDALSSHINGQQTALKTAPVFGCSMESSQ